MGQVLAHLILLPNQQKKKREAEGLPRLCSGIMQDRTPSTWSPGLPALGWGGARGGWAPLYGGSWKSAFSAQRTQ